MCSCLLFFIFPCLVSNLLVFPNNNCHTVNKSAIFGFFLWALAFTGAGNVGHNMTIDTKPTWNCWMKYEAEAQSQHVLGVCMITDYAISFMYLSFEITKIIWSLCGLTWRTLIAIPQLIWVPFHPLLCSSFRFIIVWQELECKAIRDLCDVLRGRSIRKQFKGMIYVHKYILYNSFAMIFQVCTGVMMHGYGLVKKLCSELKDFMRMHNFSTIEDFRG